jgi:hypothetical protein
MVICKRQPTLSLREYGHTPLHINHGMLSCLSIEGCFDVNYTSTLVRMASKLAIRPVSQKTRQNKTQGFCTLTHIY